MELASYQPSDLEQAEEMLDEAKRDREYYSTQLGFVENRNGIPATYTQEGLNYRNAKILELKRRVASLLPPRKEAEPQAMAVPKNKSNKSNRNNSNILKMRAPLNSNWNTNTMNLSRVNSSLFSYNTPKAPKPPSYNPNNFKMRAPNRNQNNKRNQNKTRANRKNRRSTRKN